MSVSVNVQYIKAARARRISANFSTVDLTTQKPESDVFFDDEVSLFIEGPGHEDAAARIAALINEQVMRRDQPDTIMYAISPAGVVVVPPPNDDGPTYDGPDDENEALRMETEQNAEYNRAYIEHLDAKEEERTYNEEDRLGREAHLRSVRRDDKPWTPHEDRIEEDVRAGRRDADGEPV